MFLASEVCHRCSHARCRDEVHLSGSGLGDAETFLNVMDLDDRLQRQYGRKVQAFHGYYKAHVRVCKLSASAEMSSTSAYHIRSEISCFIYIHHKTQNDQFVCLIYLLELCLELKCANTSRNYKVHEDELLLHG